MTQETPKNIAETIIDEMRTRGDFRYVSFPTSEEPESPTLIIAPKDLVLHDLTRQHREVIEALKPLQRTGKATLEDLDSLIAWTNRFKSDSTVLFGQLQPTPKLTAIADYHGAGASKVAAERGDPTASYGRHTALYTFPVSDEWKRWTAISGKALMKDEFGEFIEENAKDFLDPTPALLNSTTEGAEPWEQRMIEVAAKVQGRFGQYAALAQLSREFQVHETGHLQVSTNRDTGETHVQFLDEHRGPDGAPLRLPNLFMVAIPVFEEGALYRLAVRFRYRKAGADVRFIATLYNPEAALRDAAREALNRAAEETGVPLMMGVPGRRALNTPGAAPASGLPAHEGTTAMPHFDQAQLQSMRAAARAFLTNPELAAKTSPQFRIMMLNVVRSSRGSAPRQRHCAANTISPTGPEGGAA